jgi:hypothetical protein
MFSFSYKLKSDMKYSKEKQIKLSYNRARILGNLFISSVICGFIYIFLYLPKRIYPHPFLYHFSDIGDLVFLILCLIPAITEIITIFYVIQKNKKIRSE